ncbi:type 2 lanthipeptide synthetase LanM family protein [Plantactinospora sp. DSM 117369]
MLAASGFAAGWWQRGLTIRERRTMPPGATAPGSTPPGTAPPPRWAVDAEQALAGAVPGRPVPPRFSCWREGYAEVVRPLVEWATGQVPAHPSTRSFAARLQADLVDLAARTLTLELHQRRVAGTLIGADGQQRFADFIRSVSRRGEVTALLERYPVLARLLLQASRFAAEAYAETLARFAADRHAIADQFLGGADPGDPVAVHSQLGDRHRRGRSVSVLEFAGGQRVVYKPRSLAACDGFAALLRWLNERVPTLELRAVRSLERGDYGWQEHVHRAPCADVGGARRFYRRQGALLALLYAVHASDVHYGNLIACGDQPVVIDLETIFHPDVLRVDVARDPAARLLDSSVHRTGVLPSFLLGDHGALDVSALGGDRGHPHPTDGIDWLAPATDQMRLVRRPRLFDGGSNRPIVDDRELEPADHEDDLVEGFRTGYDAIARYRRSFLTAVAHLATPATRVVLRPTHVYRRLLDESTHPDLLRDSTARDGLFDLLSTAAGDALPQARSVPHEIADLWHGDVPIFLGHPDSTGLTASTGTRIDGVLDAGGRRCAAGKVRAMDAADRRTQEWIVRAALATRRRPGDRRHRAAPGSSEDVEGRVAARPGDPLAAARAIADDLCDRAATDGTRANWLGLEPAGDNVALMPMGAALSYGYTGVALFLTQLASLGGDARYAEIAQLAVRGIPQLLSAVSGRADLIGSVGCGGYDGFGGIGYALARIANLTGDSEVREWAYESVQLAGTAAAANGPPGVADGHAGCLAAMMAVHAELDHAPAAALAADCARLLAGLADEPHEARRAAITTTGFARGPAGIAWALHRYAAAVPAPRCRRAADIIRAWDDSPLREPWGADPGVDTPGLVNGLAGTGYRLLRIAAPERVPSVLHLEPGPTAAQSVRLAIASPAPHTTLEER